MSGPKLAFVTLCTGFRQHSTVSGNSFSTRQGHGWYDGPHMSAPLPRPAHVLTVLNLKGGVGKTHAVWLLASVCQERGRRALLLDLDTQGNLSNSFVAQEPPGPGAEALFDPAAEQDPLRLIRPTVFSHIDVLPAGPQLARFDLSD